MNWENKKVLVTGSEGMIGIELVEQLLHLKADVYVIDLKMGPRYDLRNFKNCKRVIEGKDYIFHLAGVKGSPKMTKKRPVDFMAPMLQFDTNMILEAQRVGIKGFLYTSSIAVEFLESDFHPALAKLTAEKLIEAMRIQYPKGTKYCIVRPGNVYGEFDNFDNPDAMVITSLISKALKDNMIEVWGDGSQIRDFVNAKDVARGMIEAMERMDFDPQRLCSGKGISIKRIAEIISKETNKKIKYVESDFIGPKRKVMQKESWFMPKINIEDGIKEIIKWKSQ